MPEVWGNVNLKLDVVTLSLMYFSRNTRVLGPWNNTIKVQLHLLLQYHNYNSKGTGDFGP